MTINNKIIEKLKNNQDALYREICDLKAALAFGAKDTTKNFKIIHERIKLIDKFAGKIEKKGDRNHMYLCQHIANLHDILNPIEQKIFPNAQKTRKRLRGLLGPKQLGVGENLDKRKS